MELQKNLQTACWIAHTLFMRNKVSGSSANMSFRFNDTIYITASGTCFGNLQVNSFAMVDMNGNFLSACKPSKELPLHKMLYEKSDAIGAVIHTHSFYCTAWSCLKHNNPTDIIPKYTPYLEMKVGKIGLIPYAPPGSPELFQAFKMNIAKSDGYILANHGPIIAGKDLLTAFYGLEELEESAHIAWQMQNQQAPHII
jgi:ribulose-5-phosphate 4-epimerase/fuculose-1-phosphate aldolase